MTLQQLHYFLAAIEHGTLLKAAEHLDIAQPTLSAQILRLEDSVGTALFIRTNRRLMLTEAGRRLQPFAEASVIASQQGREAVQSVREMKGGVARFGTFGNAHHYFLAEFIKDFRDRYPDMRVQIFGYNSAEVVEAVSRGELEAGLVVMPLNERNLLVSEPVWSARVGYASATPSQAERAKTVEDLASSPLILTDARWSTSDSVRTALTARALKAGVVLNPIVEVDHIQTGLQLAAMGVGDTIVTRATLHQLGYEAALTWVPLDPPMYEVFSFVQRCDAPLSAATRVLIQMLRERFSEVQRRYAHLEDVG